MSIMPPGAIETARRVMEMSYPDTCTNVSVTQTIDPETGYPVETETRTDVACRISPMDHGDESLIAGQQQAMTGYVITEPADTALSVGDRIESGSRTFEVIGFGDRSWEIDLRIWCVEINQVSS